MIRHIACLALLLAFSGTCLADDPPDSEVNPQTGFIETVTTIWDGSNHAVRLTIDRGALPLEGAGNPAHDRSGRPPPPVTAEGAIGATDDLGPVPLAVDDAGLFDRAGASWELGIRSTSHKVRAAAPKRTPRRR